MGSLFEVEDSETRLIEVTLGKCHPLGLHSAVGVWRMGGRMF